jgi:hypothetical protein
MVGSKNQRVLDPFLVVWTSRNPFPLPLVSFQEGGVLLHCGGVMLYGKL